ncbi:MAG: cysteine-rich small domain-containing protein [Desulfovibrionaceae bacterium]
MDPKKTAPTAASYRFYSNTACEYFPCHKTAHPERFNCLFCFCPLYFMDDCGGKYVLMENGQKDCKGCQLPHSPGGYDHVLAKLRRCFRQPCRLVFRQVSGK